MRTPAILLASTFLAFTGSAFSQGTTCANPTSIQPGETITWPGGSYNSTGFLNGTACAGSFQFEDAFFQLTVPTTGDYQFDTNSATWDTELALYDGVGCSATCRAYDTDSGTRIFLPGFESANLVLFGLQAGESILIRVGLRKDSHPGSGGLSVRYLDPACGPAFDDTFEPNDNKPSAAQVGDGLYSNLLVSLGSQDHYSFCLPAGNTVQVDLQFQHALGDINIDLYEVVPFQGIIFYEQRASGFSNTNNESLTWTNPASGQDRDMVLRAYMTTTGPNCNSYDMSLTGTGLCGFAQNTFCDPMDPNSSGNSTVLSASALPGSTSGIHLESSAGPPGQFGYLHVGTGVSDPGLMIGQGRFCLAITGGNRYGRYNIPGTDLNSTGRYDAQGVFQNLTGTSASGSGYDLPAHVPILGIDDPFIGLLSARDWHFQMWHRDANGGSNFSNGLTISY